MMNKKDNRKNLIKEWRRAGLVTAVCVLLLSFCVGAAHRSILQQGIAREVLRFQVLANDDSEDDQRVKLQVRDAVLSWVEKEMEEAPREPAGKDQVLSFLDAHLQDIQQMAEQVLDKNGFSYGASVAVERAFYPELSYGGCTFPAGWYQVLRIRLGEARGHNWWCLFYPRLCFADCLQAVSEEEQREGLKSVLTAEEYETLLRSPKDWKISFRWLKW